MAAVTTAVVGIAGAGMSIAQGFQSKKAARKAARAAADSLELAKRKIEIRRMEQLQVPLESYQLEQQALVAGQQQAIEGLRESGQRAVQGGLPGLQAQVQAGAEGIRQDQAQAIYDRDKLIVDEQKTADTQLANLDLNAAQGAQMAAAQADERAGAQFTAGVQGLGSAANTLYAGSKLYKTVDPAAPATAAATSGTPQVAPFAVSNGVGNTASVFAPQAGVQPLGDFNQLTRLPGINDPIQQFGIQPYDFSGIRFN
tara:strand:+ start:19295 stop:20062 length:768 start_codon:yes stop_codon:yes gene_type:complete